MEMPAWARLSLRNRVEGAAAYPCRRKYAPAGIGREGELQTSLHIGGQRRRNRNAAVFLLIIFHDR